MIMGTEKQVTVIVRMGKTVSHAAPDGVKTEAGPGEELELDAGEARRLVAAGVVILPDAEEATFHRAHAGGVLPPATAAPPPDAKMAGLAKPAPGPREGGFMLRPPEGEEPEPPKRGWMFRPG